jgi:hypothetical protein
LISDLASATRVFWPTTACRSRGQEAVHIEFIRQRPDAASDILAAIQHAKYIESSAAP